MKAIWKHPTFWGAIFSLLVLLAAYWLALAEYCDDDGECYQRLDGLNDLRPNEIGDTLAGFAGTLAFIWIIVTVWLQSRELSAQREELKLTRLEMSEQRKATQDMARAMAAQAAMVEDEKRHRDESEASKELQAIIENQFPAFRKSSVNLAWEYTVGSDRKRFELFPRIKYTRKPSELDISTETLAERFISAERFANDAASGDITLVEKPEFDHDFWWSLVKTLERLRELGKESSVDQRVRVASWQMDRAIEVAHLLPSMEIWKTIKHTK